MTSFERRDGLVGVEIDGASARGAGDVQLFILRCFGIYNIYNKLPIQINQFRNWEAADKITNDFAICNYIFTSLFVVEIVLKMMAYGL